MEKVGEADLIDPLYMASERREGPQGMRLGSWIWRSGVSYEDLQLSYLLT